MKSPYRLLAAAAVVAAPFALSGSPAQANVQVQSLCKTHPGLCQPMIGKRPVDIKVAPPTKADITTNPLKPTPPPRR